MIIEKKLDSWSQFEEITHKYLLEQANEFTGRFSVYRGHADATWHLKTTLERVIGQDKSVEGYFRLVKKIQPELETFIDRDWDSPAEQDYADSLVGYYRHRNDLVNAYLQYLRHFGFPSPMLDWSRSPFVAAYFAFRDLTNNADSIAIYDLDIHASIGIDGVEERAHIYPIFGPARKNKRHYHQQSFYTICLKTIGNTLCYASHEDPSAIGDGDEHIGEGIIKYILPASERANALQSLGVYNINAYSLMGTEESLLETLFLRSYVNREIERKIWGSQFDEKYGFW